MIMKLLVLHGGDSPEKDISELSAENICNAAAEAGYEVSKYNPVNGDEGLASAVRAADLVIIAMHGVGAEDGVIQGKLEALNAKFLGSDSAVSALTFDKVKTHELLESHGITMPKYCVVSASNFDDCELTRSKFVMKPINNGSSLDTVVVRQERDKEKLEQCRKLLTKYKTMLVEQLIVGSEVTVPVLGKKALPPILAIPPEGSEFDYENKYNGLSQEIVPIPDSMLPIDKQRELEELALRVHHLTGCKHLSRTDIMLDKDLKPFVLEINTLPGMTKESFYPKSARAVGFSMPQLVHEFVRLLEEE